MKYMPGIRVEAMLELLLPWADVSLDEEAYRTGAEEEWESACYLYHDKETGQTYYDQSFESWYEKPTEVMVPVSSDGEVESYSLILSLNQLGEAFLLADEFLSVPPGGRATNLHPRGSIRRLSESIARRALAGS